MQAAGIRTIALIVMAALFASAQCYAKCATAECGSTQAPSDGCHHPKPSHDDSRCPSQNSVFAGPDVGVAKIILSIAPIALAALTTDSAVVLTQLRLSSQPNPGSPPGGDVATAISVLRI
jgi:hypothetical protein